MYHYRLYIFLCFYIPTPDCGESSRKLFYLHGRCNCIWSLVNLWWGWVWEGKVYEWVTFTTVFLIPGLYSKLSARKTVMTCSHVFLRNLHQLNDFYQLHKCLWKACTLLMFFSEARSSWTRRCAILDSSFCVSLLWKAALVKHFAMEYGLTFEILEHNSFSVVENLRSRIFTGGKLMWWSGTSAPEINAKAPPVFTTLYFFFFNSKGFP